MEGLASTAHSHRDRIHAAHRTNTRSVLQSVTTLLVKLMNARRVYPISNELQIKHNTLAPSIPLIAPHSWLRLRSWLRVLLAPPERQPRRSFTPTRAATRDNHSSCLSLTRLQIPKRPHCEGRRESNDVQIQQSSSRTNKLRMEPCKPKIREKDDEGAQTGKRNEEKRATVK